MEPSECAPVPGNPTPSGRWAQLGCGFGWYRAYFTIPESWRGSRLLLVADGIDDVDEAFFNGVQVGANGSMPPSMEILPVIFGALRIHPEWIRYGKENLVAWRVYDKGGQGGILKGPVHLSRLDDALSRREPGCFVRVIPPHGPNGMQVKMPQ